MLGHESQRGIAVVQGGRKGVFGGQAVLHRHHHRPGVDGHHGRAHVLGCDAADDEAAAVDGDDPRHQASARFGGIDPHGHAGITFPSTNGAVGDLERFNAGQLDGDTLEHRLESRPCRHRVRQIKGGEPLDERGQLGIDHGYFGCILMPASMRIDSAFMYELRNNSTAREANSLA